jgi:hypothetical protein
VGNVSHTPFKIVLYCDKQPGFAMRCDATGSMQCAPRTLATVLFTSTMSHPHRAAAQLYVQPDQRSKSVREQHGGYLEELNTRRQGPIHITLQNG